MCNLLTLLPAAKAVNGTVKQPLAGKAFQFKNSIKNDAARKHKEEKTLPGTVLFSV